VLFSLHIVLDTYFGCGKLSLSDIAFNHPDRGVNKMSKTTYNDLWSNTKKAKFHYFSESGLVAAKDKLDKEITALVDAGKCKSGAITAYGSLNYFNVDILRLLKSKRRVSPYELYAVLRGLEHDIEQAKKFISEVA
jgi:hypothetical protein